MMCGADPVDVYVYDQGSIVQFSPQNDVARAWFNEHVESEGWQWLGTRLGVPASVAESLMSGLLEAGFNVVLG